MYINATGSRFLEDKLWYQGVPDQDVRYQPNDFFLIREEFELVLDQFEISIN